MPWERPTPISSSTELRSAATGALVAEMRLQSMMLKGSFDGYGALRAQSDARAAAAPAARL